MFVNMKFQNEWQWLGYKVPKKTNYWTKMPFESSWFTCSLKEVAMDYNAITFLPVLAVVTIAQFIG